VWKAFRLCIFDEDRDRLIRLLNATIWPDSIKICPWYFKTAAASGDGVSRPRSVVAADVNDNVAVGIDDIRSDANTEMDITNAAASRLCLYLKQMLITKTVTIL